MVPGDKSIDLFDTSLRIVKKIKDISIDKLILDYDIDRDNEKELVFACYSHEYLIFRKDLTDPVKILFGSDPFSRIPYGVSVKNNGDNIPELCFKIDNHLYFYTYHYNPLHALKYLIWIGIYLILFFLFYLIRLVQQLQLRKKIELENRLNALQLKTIKSQMDPHFMFNILNSISTMVLKDNKQEAHGYIIKFSSLIRSLLTNSEKISIPLKDELKFVENYLSLEKLRFKEKLSYHFQIDEDVNLNISMPRMILQLFVENSVKHAFNQAGNQNHLEIKISDTKTHVTITIQDYSEGNQTTSNAPGFGKGTKIVNEMIELFNKNSASRVSYSYLEQDKSESDVNYHSGTTVVVKIQKD
jgi:hypothetical protein